MPKNIRNWLNWFVFFLVFPSLNILGNSVTFYIFLVLISRLGLNFIKVDKHNKVLFWLFISILTSSFLMPEMERHPGIFTTIKFDIQFIYWIIVAVFFIHFYKYLDLTELSKWVFYGTICSIIGFYVVPFNFAIGPVKVTLYESRNSFVFDLLCGIPFSFIYLQKSVSRRNQVIYLFLFFISMLMTNGRSGGIIILLEVLLISILVFPKFAASFKYLFAIIIIGSVSLSFSPDQFRVDLAENVSKFNPRLGKLILGAEDDDEGDLKFDKSWLHRELMVDKSLEIFSLYPIFGVGPNCFRYYDSELSTYDNYVRLGNEDKEWYNNRSAHNSYIQILSELGLFGLIPLIIILIVPIFMLFRNLIFNPTIYLLPFVAILGISIHFYAISALTGAIPWFIFGVCWGAIKNKIVK